MEKIDWTERMERVQNYDYTTLKRMATCNGRLKTYRGYEWKFIV
jgi:hypothetical protein